MMPYFKKKQKKQKKTKNKNKNKAKDHYRQLEYNPEGNWRRYKI